MKKLFNREEGLSFITDNLLVVIVGVVFTLCAGICMHYNLENPADRSFFQIPIWLIGLGGYGLIVLSGLTFSVNRLSLGFHCLLNLTAGGFTFYLIAKAFAIHHFCPFCFLVWIVNFTLAIRTFFFIKNSWQDQRRDAYEYSEISP